MDNFVNRILIYVGILGACLLHDSARDGFASPQQCHQDTNSGCFMVLVAKGATADGSVLLAHNNDLSGKEISGFERYSRKKHNPGEHVEFPTGLVIPQVPQTFEWMVLRIKEGFKEGDAVAINEYQVAVAGGVALGRDRNRMACNFDPLVEEGLSGGVRYIALERSKTARECVNILGKLYNRYGVSYPSGVGIADPDEVWYIEAGGGHCWAAVRLPDSCCWVQANGYRIGVIDPTDTVNVMTSPELLKSCLDSGLWNQDDGPFSFRDVFGGRYWKSREEKYYNTRRVWRGMDILSPSMELLPDMEKYPMYFVPDRKVELKILFRILRDHYGNTKFDAYPEVGNGSDERLIASSRCVHTDVIQIRADLPIDIGAVLWGGLCLPEATVYIPFYFGINSIPDDYLCSEYSCGKAFNVYRALSEYLLADYKGRLSTILKYRKLLESEFIDDQPLIEAEAIELYHTDQQMSRDYLTDYVKRLCRIGIEMASDILDEDEM